MEYLIGIDLGTSGTKTVLFDKMGKVISSASVEYPMFQEKKRLGGAGACRLVACGCGYHPHGD